MKLHDVVGFKNPSGEFPAYVIPIVIKNKKHKLVLQYDENTLNYYDLCRDYNRGGQEEAWDEIFMPKLDLLDGFLFAKNRHTVEYIKNCNEASFIKKLLKKKQISQFKVPAFERRLKELKNKK